MLKNLHCKTCAHAERICKSNNVYCICRPNGIGILPEVVDTLKIVGCNSYKYDGNGLTDLERSFNKKGN
jgi:hypothetical protein